MKSTVPFLALLLASLAVAVRAEDAPASATTAPASALSAEVAKQLAATLPGASLSPAEAKPADLSSDLSALTSATAEATRAKQGSVTPTQAKEEAPNPDVLELPKMTVKQRPRPRLGENVILGPKAFNEELAKKNLSALDRSFLNKFTLPLFGISAAERAREDYNIAQKRQFLSDVMTIARAAELTDPANAQALREAAAKP